MTTITICTLGSQTNDYNLSESFESFAKKTILKCQIINLKINVIVILYDRKAVDMSLFMRKGTSWSKYSKFVFSQKT